MRRLPTGAPARVLVATRPPGAAFGAPVEVAGAIKAGVEDVINHWNGHGTPPKAVPVG